jgi:hypothetical protein
MSITGRSLAPALLLFSWMAFASQSFADSGIDLKTSEGALSGTDADLSSSGSILASVERFAPGILTPAAASGGRSFAADGYGLNGIPHGMLFFGTFSGPLTWVITNLTNETHNYTLTGMVRGTMDEKTADGMTSQLTISTGREYFNGSPRVDGDDDVRSSSVPEPSTLGLFGTGTFLLAGELRRRGRVSR